MTPMKHLVVSTVPGPCNLGGLLWTPGLNDLPLCCNSMYSEHIRVFTREALAIFPLLWFLHDPGFNQFNHPHPARDVVAVRMNIGFS